MYSMRYGISEILRCAWRPFWKMLIKKMSLGNFLTSGRKDVLRSTAWDPNQSKMHFCMKFQVRPGPRFINLKRYELVLISHLHMRIVKIQRVGQSARILPIHVKEGDIRGKSTSFYILVSGRPRSR